MATSSILGGSAPPPEISGKDIHSLGPSDNSDSGSDAIGAYGEDELASDSDAVGTGERASIGAQGGKPDADILPDHTEASPDGDAAEDDDADGDLADDIEADLDDDGDDGDDGLDSGIEVDRDADDPDFSGDGRRA